MLKNIFAAFLAVTLVLAVSSQAFAQDSPDMKAKKETPKPMKEADMSGLMSVTCDPACGFAVISHDKAEITSMVKQHSKAHHKKDLTDAEVIKMMAPAGMQGSKDKTKTEGDPHKY